VYGEGGRVAESINTELLQRILRIWSVVLLPMEITLNGIVCSWNKAINEVLL